MRYINLQAQLEAAGWSAEIVDSDTRRNGVEKPCSHVYAVRGSERVFLCSFGRMWQMSRQKCAQIVAALPQEPSFAQGECPNCGHDWTAHSAYIANGERICYQACHNCYQPFPASNLVELEQNGPLGFVRVDVCQSCYDKLTRPHPPYCLCDQCAHDYYAMTGEMP